MGQGQLAGMLESLDLLAGAEQPALVAGRGKARARLINWIGEQQIAALALPLGTGLGEHVARLGGKSKNHLPMGTPCHQSRQ